VIRESQVRRNIRNGKIKSKEIFFEKERESRERASTEGENSRSASESRVPEMGSGAGWEAKGGLGKKDSGLARHRREWLKGVGRMARESGIGLGFEFG
jgi:hypothetical protein